jgi:hypothetical protein
MGFDGKTFEEMFQTDEDWKAFYQYMVDREMESLLAHEGFLEKQKRPAFAMFLKMADVRTQAEYKAFVLWEKTKDYRKYGRELADADRQHQLFRDWMARSYSNRYMVDSFDGHAKFEKLEINPVTGEKEWKEEIE